MGIGQMVESLISVTFLLCPNVFPLYPYSFKEIAAFLQNLLDLCNFNFLLESGLCTIVSNFLGQLDA